MGWKWAFLFGGSYQKTFQGMGNKNPKNTKKKTTKTKRKEKKSHFLFITMVFLEFSCLIAGVLLLALDSLIFGFFFPCFFSYFPHFYFVGDWLGFMRMAGDRVFRSPSVKREE